MQPAPPMNSLVPLRFVDLTAKVVSPFHLKIITGRRLAEAQPHTHTNRHTQIPIRTGHAYSYCTLSCTHSISRSVSPSLSCSQADSPKLTERAQKLGAWLGRKSRLMPLWSSWPQSRSEVCGCKCTCYQLS